MTEHIKNSIQDAQLVLIGIGEEFEIKRLLKKDETYQKLLTQTKSEWVYPFLEKLFIDKYGHIYLEVYKQLAVCLQNKNYFIISLCQDGLIRQVELNTERIVEPCGTYQKLQCADGCCEDLHDVSIELMDQIKAYAEGNISEEVLKAPVCSKCGKLLVFNRVEENNYLEEGYLPEWKKYKLWLQGTVNKKLCILELGAGMKYPTVIRWPFEKVTFFNQKAELFRVHSKLYQMTEEIKERGYGIHREPLEFLKELSNKF